MKSEFEIERDIMRDEVDHEAAKLVRAGIAPWNAIGHAKRIVRQRRQRAERDRARKEKAGAQ